ncbi:MAG TPA: metal ABC transporter substrate-binding protein [Lactobacillus sp.]|nr:metal ABC transporter substrate-binding protein [Lactobacillus sp.]
MKQFRRGLLSLLVFIGAVVILILTSPQQLKAHADSSQPIHVVTSVDFYGSVAKAVLGQHGTVTSIINSPSVDPHDFEPTTKDGIAVSKANFILYNGIDYDGWMKKLSKSNGNHNQTTVRVGEDVLGKKTGANEHVWYQPKTMPKLANYLAKKFGHQAPQYRKQYAANAKKYIASLKPLQAQVAKLRAHSKGQHVDVSEPVFDYTLDALGYKRNNSKFELAVENGTDPSPKSIKTMQADITHHRIAFFVNNSQASDKTVSAMVDLAKKHHVPVLNVTETLPKGQTYKSWMMKQYHALAKIQSQTK